MSRADELVVHAPGLCDCDYTEAEKDSPCPCCGVPENVECVNNMDDIVRAKDMMETFLVDLLNRRDLVPRCRSGAHFLGNCSCTGGRS